ncbi:unnamed protein product [Chironomus riparius]|uniref:C2H2-type domain-containing protein n=1 Tax=Chironomus riparius TaxID=315576 RepID=A0A9N9WVU5_9DIPT|nr:unnamed protein product [Chironomus riparius]
MPRKISISKVSTNQKLTTKEATLESPRIRKCRVILSDFVQLESNYKPEIFKNIKIEPEREYLAVLEPNLKSDVFHVAKKIKIEEQDTPRLVKLEEIELERPQKSGNIVENSQRCSERINPNSCEILKTSRVLRSSRTSRNPQTINKSPQTIKKSTSDVPKHLKTIQCRFCPTKSLSFSVHNNHMSKVHSDKLYTCDLCFSKCPTLIGIKSHMTIKHLNKKFQPFICDYCGKEFKKKAKFYYHVLTHRPRIECEICHLKLKHESMPEHLRDFHVNDRKFNCKMCEKTFKADKDLKRHEKVHLKKFNCLVCFRKFRLQYDLNVHVHQTHENPGSFKCHILK